MRSLDEVRGAPYAPLRAYPPAIRARPPPLSPVGRGQSHGEFVLGGGRRLVRGTATRRQGCRALRASRTRGTQARCNAACRHRRSVFDEGRRGVSAAPTALGGAPSCALRHGAPRRRAASGSSAVRLGGGAGRSGPGSSRRARREIRYARAGSSLAASLEISPGLCMIGDTMSSKGR